MAEQDRNAGYGPPGGHGGQGGNGFDGAGGGFGPPPASAPAPPPMPPVPPSAPPPVPGQSGQPMNPYQGQGYGQPPMQPPGPGFGQPPAPGYGQPPPGGPVPGPGWGGGPPGAPGPGMPPHRRRGGGPWLAIAIVLVVLAGLGVGGYFVMNKLDLGSDSDKPPADALQPLWDTSLPSTQSTIGEQSGLRRIWTNARFPVYGDDNGVRAYDPDTGEQKWKVKAPKGAGELCALSPRASIHGVGAAVFDSGGDDCAFLVAFDTDSGRTLWSKNLKGQQKTSVPLVNVGTDVIMANIGDSYSAYSISSGVPVSTVHARGSDCDTNVAQSEEFVAISSTCSDAQPEDQLTIRNLEFGDIYTFPGEKRNVVRVLADKPLTLLLQDEGEGNKDGATYLQTYDDKGKAQHTYPLAGKLSGLQFDSRTTFTDQDGTLLVSSYKNDAGVAVTDLTTGKLLWSNENARPVALDGEEIIALAQPDSESEYVRLVSYGVKDGDETVKGSLYSKDGGVGTVTTDSLGWFGDQLFVAGERADDGRQTLRSYPSSPDSSPDS